MCVCVCVCVCVKVKWSRYRPGAAQRVGRGIALLFPNHGTTRGYVVSSTSQPHFAPGKDPVPILQEIGWAPGPVWTGGKSRPQRDSIPDRSARSQSLYLLSYRAHLIYIYICVCVCVCVCVFKFCEWYALFWMVKHMVHTDTVRLTQWLRFGRSDASGAFRRSEQSTGLHVVNYTEYAYKGSPVEIPAPEHWNLIGRGMTLATCAIAQQHSTGSFFSFRFLSRTEKLDAPFRNGISFPQEAFAKLRKRTISFVMSVCLSVRMKLASHWTHSDEISY